MNGSGGKGVVVLAILALGASLAFAAWSMQKMQSSPMSAAQGSREIIVAVPVLDTDKLVDKAAALVMEKAADRLEASIRAKVQAAPSPTPPPPAAQPQPIAPPAPERPKMPPLPKVEKPTDFGPIPQGSYKTEMGALPAVGRDEALVYVFVLSEFQCPVCKRSAEGLAPFILENDPDIRWIFWHNPLEMHRRARPAAKASMAAFRQGKFWEFHDAAFAQQFPMEEQDLERFARSVGLDMEQYAKDKEDPALDYLFNATMRVATLLESRGTPSFVINGKKQVGWGSAGGIKSMIDRELTAMRSLVASGKSVDEARRERARINSENETHARVFIDYMLDGKVPPEE